MSLEYVRTFGADAAAPAQGAAATQTPAEKRPPATAWLNVGYVAEGAEEGDDYSFVSLASGIPLDQIKPIAIKSVGTRKAAFDGSRNQLHADLMAKLETLQPGESCLVNLQIQLRKVVGDDVAAPAVEGNPFSRSQPLFG